MCTAPSSTYPSSISASPEMTPGTGISGFDNEPCSEPHAGQVFAVIADPTGGADRYPGNGVFLRTSAQQCLDAFPAFAGTTLTRSGLAVSSYYPDREAWEKRVLALRAVSLEALQAIDAKSANGLFDVGDRIDTACENCHRQYWYPNEVIPEVPADTK